MAINHGTFTLPLTDGHVATARLNGTPQQPLIIMIHGLNTTMNSLLSYGAAEFFSRHGYAVLRFNLYDYAENCRDMFDCTLAIHVADTLDVIAYARKQGFTRISVIGHSYGGLTALMLPLLELEHIVLWDPSHPDAKVFDQDRYLPEYQAYWRANGINFILGEALVDEYRTLQTAELIKPHTIPVLICSVSNGLLGPTNRDYFRRLKQHHVAVELREFAEANHSFTEDDQRDQLFQQTLEWLER